MVKRINHSSQWELMPQLESSAPIWPLQRSAPVSINAQFFFDNLMSKINKYRHPLSCNVLTRFWYYSVWFFCLIIQDTSTAACSVLQDLQVGNAQLPASWQTPSLINLILSGPRSIETTNILCSRIIPTIRHFIPIRHLSCSAATQHN